MLDAQIKQQKKDGKENTSHKPPIEKHDIEKLKNHEVILPTKPLSLLRNVWFHVSLFWCRRGREGQRSLTKNSFRFDKDPEGREFVTMNHDESTKNHPGGLADTPSYEKFGRMYKTNSTTDGFSSLKIYLEKINPHCQALFQYPKRNWRATDTIWYENRPLGINKLAKMMKDISEEAGLSKVYTNHCVRATAITLWADAGLSDRQIMSISGHRSESSLKSYHARPSSSQLRQCSDVLVSALGDDNPQEATQVMQPLSIYNRPPGMQFTATMSHQDKTSLNNMFTGCTMSDVHITFN
ncbi:hypothetical protein QZH41_002897 [Actinostola sp. cb2023]|nr:hypothetical protein QZH41_002897 [Actinostola sp. cb2023]